MLKKVGRKIAIIINVRDMYRQVIPSIISNEESLKEFLMFASNLYTRSFENVSLIYAQRPTASMVATYDEWNTVKRYVKKGTKGIAIIKDHAGIPRIDYVYDIADTKGAKIPDRWKFQKEKEKAVLEELAHDRKPVESLHEYIINEIDHVLYSGENNYMERISEVCCYSSRQLEDNPEWIYRIARAVKESAEYLTACRCDVDVRNFKNLHPNMGIETIRILVFILCDTTLKVAKNVLNTIAKAVIKVEMKERGFAYEKRNFIIQGGKRDLPSESNTLSQSKSGFVLINKKGNTDLKATEGETFHQL